MSDLTYLPTDPPPRAFRVGDEVEILVRGSVRLSVQRVARVGARIVTGCGRHWTLAGEWIDGDGSCWPFPSIRLISI